MPNPDVYILDEVKESSVCGKSNPSLKYALWTQPKIAYTTVSAYLISASINEELHFQHKIFSSKVRTQEEDYCIPR